MSIIALANLATINQQITWLFGRVLALGIFDPGSILTAAGTFSDSEIQPPSELRHSLDTYKG